MYSIAAAVIYQFTRFMGEITIYSNWGEPEQASHWQ